MLNLGALSFQNNLPILYNTTNPSGFFIAILAIPMGIVYSYTLDIYYVALTLKLLLFFFFTLTVLLIKEIVIKYGNPKLNSKVWLAIILFNPVLVFVNFVWAELVIVPVFFITLTFYIVRMKPFNNYVFNIFFATISFYISVFFFLYPIIFAPTIIIYTNGTKYKALLLASLTIGGIIFLIAQIILFQGFLFNYVGSLTGSINSLSVTSLRSGFFYFISVSNNYKPIVEILLIIFISIIFPIILKYYRYSEQAVLYLTSALFLFISIQVDMDNFLFMVPFVFLASVEISNEKFLKSRTVLMSLILYIPIIFAPFYYYHNYTYDIYYWFYPMTHYLGPIVSFYIVNDVLLAYNYTFLILLLVTLAVVLASPRKNGPKVLKENISNKILLPRNFRKKCKVILLVFLLLPLPFSVIYNNADNAVSITNPSRFPVLYFYPEFSLNSPIAEPIGHIPYSFQTDNSSISILSSEHSLILERNLTGQFFNMNLNIKIVTTSTENTVVVKTNSWNLSLEEFNSLKNILTLSFINGTNYTQTVPSNKNINLSFTNTIDSSSLNLNGKEFKVQPSNYIYFGKTTNNYLGAFFIISELHISHVGKMGYYLIPAFFAFYYPIIFSAGLIAIFSPPVRRRCLNSV
jgi:hypothetical protein